MPHAVAVDIGGTFTDLVAYEYEATRSSTPRARPPTGIWSRRCSIASQGQARRRATRELRQSRHHAGDQRADPARGRQGGAGHHRGLSRHAGDRRGNRARAVRSALSAATSRSFRASCASRSTSASTRTGEIVTPLDAGELDALAGKMRRRSASRRSRSASSTPTPIRRMRRQRRAGAARAAARTPSSPPAPSSRANGTSTSAPRRSPPMPMSDRRSAATSRGSRADLQASGFAGSLC